MAKDKETKETLDETSEETGAETSSEEVEASGNDTEKETVSDSKETGKDEEPGEEAETSEASESSDESKASDADEKTADEAYSEAEGSEKDIDKSDFAAEENPDDAVEESDEHLTVAGNGASDAVVPPAAANVTEEEGMKGIAAYFDLPDELMLAAAHTRDSQYNAFEAYSPFPIHGMDDAMGLGRSWIPWVTFGAGTAGFITANAIQFFTMTFDWPMIIGGKPYAPWPSFVPIMFELTVLFAGVTTAIVMLIAAGCFRKPFIIDPEITKDRFVLWISADDDAFDADEVRDFLETLNPVEIRTITKGA